MLWWFCISHSKHQRESIFVDSKLLYVNSRCCEICEKHFESLLQYFLCVQLVVIFESSSMSNFGKCLNLFLNNDSFILLICGEITLHNHNQMTSQAPAFDELPK